MAIKLKTVFPTMTLKTKLPSLTICCLFTGTALPALAENIQQPPAPESQLTQQITLDGRLDESLWQTAQRYTNFFQVVPASLNNHDEKVDARVHVDEQGLHIGIINHQNKAVRKNQFNLYDGFIQADFNRIFIDFSADGSSAYLFVPALGGGKQDAILTKDRTSNYDWDTNWQYKYHETDEFWSAEVFIPWHSVSFRPNKNPDGSAKIAISFQLYDLAKNQIFASQPMTQNDNDFFLKMPEINVKIPEKNLFSFMPYVTTTGNFLSDETDFDGGFDLIFKPSHHQKLNVAVNPDFGQVDSDEIVVNYSALETLRTDKRPFFTQDIALFSIAASNDTKLIHTRRMGAGADNEPATLTPIDAAIRAVHMGENFQLGAFAVQEDSLNSDVGKNFYAARGVYNSDNLQTGLLITQTKRPFFNRKTTAYAFDNQYSNEHWQLNSALFRTSVDQDNQTINGNGFSANVNYQWNPRTSLDFSYLDLDQDISLNDLGYMQRNNWQVSTATFNHSIVMNHSLLTSVGITATGQYQASQDGYKLPADQSLNVRTYLNNGGSAQVTLGHQTQGLDDLIAHGYGQYRQSARNRLKLSYSSPYSGQFSWSGSFLRTQEGISGYASQYGLDMTYFPSQQFKLSFNNNVRISDDWLIGAGQGRLAQYSRKLWGSNLNLSGALSSDVELSVNLQWSLLETRDKKLFELTDRNLTSITSTDKGFNDSRVSAQVRLRYNMGPSSDIYLVYARNGIDISATNPLMDGGSDNWKNRWQNAWHQPDTDQLIFKVRHAF